jgi:hypothetical protein
VLFRQKVWGTKFFGICKLLRFKYDIVTKLLSLSYSQNINSRVKMNISQKSAYSFNRLKK